MVDHANRRDGGGGTGLGVLLGVVLVTILAVSFFVIGGEVSIDTSQDSDAKLEAPAGTVGGGNAN